MTASHPTLRFLQQIGQLNREALREIRVLYKLDMTPWSTRPSGNFGAMIRNRRHPFHLPSWRCESPREGANFFNVLAKCSSAAITIVTTFRTLAVLDGTTQYRAFVNMHGFKKATTRLTKNRYADCYPQSYRTRCYDQDASEKAILQRLDNGANRMKSPCPEGCSVHKYCAPMSTNATIHLEVECDICWECAYDDFLDVWVEKKGCIFGLQQ